jgi:hypothetical protein
MWMGSVGYQNLHQSILISTTQTAHPSFDLSCGTQKEKSTAHLFDGGHVLNEGFQCVQKSHHAFYTSRPRTGTTSNSTSGKVRDRLRKKGNGTEKVAVRG